MIGVFYDFFLFIVGICLFPKVLSKWQRLPRIQLKPVVLWIHAVSVGEMRAAAPLFLALKKKYPEASILISCITRTGFEEAKRSMAGADLYFFLPWDISWIIRPIVSRLRPNVLLLVEGDFWYQLMRAVKKQGGSVALVSGKMSERSANRWAKLAWLQKAVFEYIDVFCVQSERFRKRFLQIGVDSSKIHVTGNLKLNMEYPLLSIHEKAEWKKKFGIKEHEKVIVIGSTHEPEEKELILALKPLMSKAKILIAPRHPERFISVAKTLKALDISFVPFSGGIALENNVVLIDAMGVLSICYQLADAAIVAGSFYPHLQGHNIFEPVCFGVPVLFGPYMTSQQDLVELIQEASCGRQVGINGVLPALLEWFGVEGRLAEKKEAAWKCRTSCQGAVDKTIKHIDPLVLNSNKSVAFF